MIKGRKLSNKEDRMNKLMIVGFSLFVFALNGCGKSAKDKCKDKGEGWIWNVEKKECVEAATTKEDCGKKGAGWTWDESSKQCKAVASIANEDMTKEACKAKGEDWIWDETNKQCNQIVYMTITVPSESDNNFQVTAYTQGGINYLKEYSKSLELYWWDNEKGREANVNPVVANPGECVKIHKSNLSTLMVIIQFTFERRDTGFRGSAGDYLCGRGHDVSGCDIGNYKLAQRSSDGRAILEPLSDVVDLGSCREVSLQSED